MSNEQFDFKAGDPVTWRGKAFRFIANAAHGGGDRARAFVRDFGGFAIGKRVKEVLQRELSPAPVSENRG